MRQSFDFETSAENLHLFWSIMHKYGDWNSHKLLIIFYTNTRALITKNSRRRIEPRSPAWQMGILTETLSMTDF
jgi:hypothetical protein